MEDPDELNAAFFSAATAPESACLAALGFAISLPSDRTADFSLTILAKLLKHTAIQAEPSAWVVATLRTFVSEFARGDLMHGSPEVFAEFEASVEIVVDRISQAHFGDVSGVELAVGLSALNHLARMLQKPVEERTTPEALEADGSHLDAIVLAADVLDASVRRARLRNRLDVTNRTARFWEAASRNATSSFLLH